MSRIFISHSSRNNDRAIELHDWLAGNGWDDIFLDIDPRDGLAPGERWQQELRKAADRCQVVLCVITPEWLASDWCRSEFLLAKTFGKRMFPIIFGGVDVDRLPKDLTANDQAVDVVRDPHGWERLREGLRRAGLDPESFAFAPGRRPYPGFEPLTEEDAAVFFGREAQIVRGLDRLRSMSEAGVERMFVILGASGAGKSSYLRAGLWPRLKRDDHNFLALPVIRPERGALTGKFGLFAALEVALGKSPTSSQDIPRSRAGIADFVSARTDNLCRLFAALRAASPAVLTAHSVRKPPTVVIAIDQGEELFNDDGRAEASRFLDLLTGALQQDLRVIVILAIRSDSFPSLQNEAKLASVAKVPFDLPPLPATSMRLVIEGPVQVAQPPITLDPQLVEALLEDAQGADTLPLLAFTLGRLQQDFGAEGKLMLGHYERLGRVSGAVNAAVADALTEGVRRGLLPSDKVQLDDLLRETFIPHLARVNNAGQFVRHVATKADLSPRSQRVVDLFVEARLLLRDRRPTPSGDDDIVEVAHEALLRKWPALNSWLEADREFLIGKEQLVQDIVNWRDANEEQKDEALLSGLNLTRARQWLVERRALDLSAEEREYIGASITRANAQARHRRWLVGATVGVLVTIGVVLGLVDRNRRDADARAQAGAQLLVQLVTTKLIHIQGLQVNTLDAILTASKSTFDELVSAVGDQPAFLQYRAELMSGFGANYLKVKGLGLDKANDAYGEALRIYRKLAARDSSAITWQRGIADQIDNIGVVLQQQGKIELALQNFRQSLALRQPIGAREPNDPISYRDVASSEYNIGEIMMQLHRAQESLDSDRAALDQIKKALSLDPNNHALELKLSLILVSVGVAYQALGFLEEHRQANQDALAIRKQLHEVQPDNAEWSRYLAWSYFWVGNDYLDNDDAIEALKNHEQCLSLRQALANSDGGDLVAKYDLAWAYHAIGSTYKTLDNIEQARESFTQAFNLRKELVAADPGNAKWHKDLALSHETMGDIADLQKDVATALDNYKSGIAILDDLIRKAPTNRNWRDNLSNILDKMARDQKCNDDLEGALASYLRALNIRAILLSESPNNIIAMTRTATSEGLVGEVLQMRGEKDEALGHYRNAADLRAKIAEREPKDAKAQNELANIRAKIDKLTTDAKSSEGHLCSL